MARFHIDRILESCIKQGASEVHLSQGRPPILCLQGCLQNLAMRALEQNDLVWLMRSITPDERQKELEEEGNTDFGFNYGDMGRFNVSACRQNGNITMVLQHDRPGDIFAMTPQ